MPINGPVNPLAGAHSVLRPLPLDAVNLTGTGGAGRRRHHGDGGAVLPLGQPGARGNARLDPHQLVQQLDAAHRARGTR